MPEYSATFDGLWDGLRALNHLYILCAGTSQLLIIVVLAELGNGFLFALSHERTKKQKIVYFVALGLTVVLLILNTVSVIYSGVLTADSGMSNSAWSAKIRSLNELSLAQYILTLFASVALIAQAAYVKHQYRKVAPSSSVSYVPNLPSSQHLPTPFLWRDNES